VKRRLLLLVDALLLVVAAFLGVRLYEAWALRAPAPPTEPASSPSAEVAAPPAAVAPTPPLTAFNVVAERNLFSPTRSETAPEPTRAGGGPAAAAPPAPKPRLYGVVILAEGRDRAYLEDMQRRKVFAYSVGDLVGDARLEQIKSDRVVLRRGGETFEVLLNDPAKPRPPAPPSGSQSGVQSSEPGGVVRPTPTRPPVPAPPTGGIRSPGRPRVPTPVPAPPPSSEGQESPAEEE
jgi:type II secretion system (T2SS) protein C